MASSTITSRGPTTLVGSHSRPTHRVLFRNRTLVELMKHVPGSGLRPSVWSKLRKAAETQSRPFKFSQSVCDAHEHRDETPFLVPTLVMNGAFPPLCIAYYVSGHGFGHATRVSAIVEAILELNASIEITIVSTAPSYVFNCLSKGANYRYAEVDPVIVQPVAYAVDRRQSLKVLRDFLAQRDDKLEEEAEWMKENEIDCVLSDAVFLACAAANLACIPSALLTNFTFDSNWSWLSSDIPQDTPWAIISNHLDFHHLMDGIPDDPTAYEPLDETELAPLVEQMRKDYSCADCLFILQGAIPFPSFSVDTPLPATHWVSHGSKMFYPEVIQLLNDYRTSPPHLRLLPPIPYPSVIDDSSRKRRIIPAPLIVRHSTPDIFTPSRRSELLDSCGVPEHLRDPATTNILIVSFGGQKFKRPGSGANTPAHMHQSPDNSPHGSSTHVPTLHSSTEPFPPSSINQTHITVPLVNSPLPPKSSRATSDNVSSAYRPPPSRSKTYLQPSSSHHHIIPRRPRQMSAPPRFVTPTHIFIPGAPGPVPNPTSPMLSNGRSPQIEKSLMASLADVSLADSSSSDIDAEGEYIPRLLPPGWIAIICGGSGFENEDLLPEDLFVAPREVYMPDLMIVGDVLLGKLGYGTVSEAIDSATPFMYVPRPAICEEMGLKLLLDQSGVGLSISREKYESGDWADLIELAWARGREAKERRRVLGTKVRDERIEEGRTFAKRIVGWIRGELGMKEEEDEENETTARGGESKHASEGIANGGIDVKKELGSSLPTIQVNP